MELYTVLFYFVLALLFLAILKCLVLFIQPNFSHLRQLRGPKRDQLFWGNLKQIGKQIGLGLWEKWEREFGKVFVFKVFLNVHVFISSRQLGSLTNDASIFRLIEFTCPTCERSTMS